MKILVVSDLPHFVTVGAEMQAARLIEGWLDQGHEVICLGRRMGEGPVRIGRHEVTVHRIGTVTRWGRWMRGGSYALSLAFLLWRYRHWADVVYTQFLGEAAIVVSSLKAVGLLHSHLVSRPAGTRDQGDVHFLKTIPASHWLIRLLDTYCDAINLISPLMDSELREAGFSGSNFTHIPNGVPILPLEGNSVTTPVRFITVGRLAPEKGLDILLKAVAFLKDRLAPRQVVVVGAGPEETRLREQARRLGIDDRIEWAGNLDQDGVRARLEQADVFVLPSRWEGLSNAGIEAMERGLVPILSDCGGLDAYVSSEMGWVVPRGDAEALARVMMEALSLPRERLREMGRRARMLAEREFDLDRVVEWYLALFADLEGAG